MLNRESKNLQCLEKQSIENTGFKEIPEWLTEKLFLQFLRRDFPNFRKITKFVIKPAVATGENYMTVMLRATFEVQLSDSSSKSVSYMVKIKPNPESLQTMIKEWQIFKKEHKSYSKYIPEFEKFYNNVGTKRKFAPRLLEPSQLDINDDFLILEDLYLKGFKNGSRQQGLDMVHTKAVLEKLSEFHAASALYVQRKEQFPSMYDQSLKCKKDLFVNHRLNTSKIFREHLHLYGNAQHLEEKLKKYAENQYDPQQMNFEGQPGEFYVLNHGDLWVNNIMFQYNDDGSLTETFFVDFQLCCFGSPAQDLIYFLLSSTNLAIKLKYFDYFIAHYHKYLMKNLRLLNYEGRMPKLRDIHVALFKYDCWVYTTVVFLLPIVLSEYREDANVDNLLGEAGDDFRRSLYSNPHYAENMRELLPWLDSRGAFDL